MKLTSATQTGLDHLLSNPRAALRGRRVGLVTHPAAVARDWTHATDALLAAGVELTALFGPEHGLSGTAADGDPIDHAVDARTGLPIFSLYGDTLAPTAAMLGEADVLLFDMQDIGARFYTYISTLLHVLRGAAAHGVPVVVLDRPNPLGGVVREGPLLEREYASFVGVAPLPVRHGLTVGELARWFVHHFALDVDLEVVPMQGWRRSMWFEQTGLPWVATSPNLPRPSTATVYPGTCLIEGTNLSEGRGTALPFELVGAPWVDGFALASRLNAAELPGVRWRATHFAPLASKFTGEPCAGVQLHVTNRDVFRPVAAGLHLIAAVRSQNHVDFAWNAEHFDRLVGDGWVREALETSGPVEEMVARWRGSLAEFAGGVASFLLYG